ncbi:MAG: CDP-diacylglycerol--glycerol-3-phosphate 3-phosphatidyltransferase [Bacillota bacterium]|nr:CDP-diacylglycerol--glycerol-3-phosphate 3-phosphatidyltransferase [Bacillota bacterium]
MNLPNKLTLSRILLVPVFMIFILPIPDWIVNSQYLKFIHLELTHLNDFILHTGKYIAAGIFIVASLTDGVDGYIARKTKQVTRMGKFLDPIADKLLVTAALLVLLQNDRLSGWAAMFIIGREFIVTGLRLIAAGEGIVIAASNWGKIKTATTMVAIVLSLLDNFPLSIFTDFPFDRVFMFIAVLVTVYSGYDYIAKNSKILDYGK